MHGGTPRPMGVQEELLFRNVALAYASSPGKPAIVFEIQVGDRPTFVPQPAIYS